MRYDFSFETKLKFVKRLLFWGSLILISLIFYVSLYKVYHGLSHGRNEALRDGIMFVCWASPAFFWLNLKLIYGSVGTKASLFFCVLIVVCSGVAAVYVSSNKSFSDSIPFLTIGIFSIIGGAVRKTVKT